MSLTGLMILSIVVIILITVLFIIATNRGYKYKHTVDPLPSKQNGNETNTLQDRSMK